jgi:hypothetical protein
MALEKRALVDVQVPIGDADGEVAECVRSDVDAAGRKTVALHRREGSIVPDDLGDRIRRRHVASSSAIVRDARPDERSRSSSREIRAASETRRLTGRSNKCTPRGAKIPVAPRENRDLQGRTPFWHPTSARRAHVVPSGVDVGEPFRHQQGERDRDQQRWRHVSLGFGGAFRPSPT